MIEMAESAGAVKRRPEQEALHNEIVKLTNQITAKRWKGEDARGLEEELRKVLVSRPTRIEQKEERIEEKKEIVAATPAPPVSAAVPVKVQVAAEAVKAPIAIESEKLPVVLSKVSASIALSAEELRIPENLDYGELARAPEKITVTYSTAKK